MLCTGGHACGGGVGRESRGGSLGRESSLVALLGVQAVPGSRGAQGGVHWPGVAKITSCIQVGSCLPKFWRRSILVAVLGKREVPGSRGAQGGVRGPGVAKLTKARLHIGMGDQGPPS